jgi:hypothetical protein
VDDYSDRVSSLCHRLWKSEKDTLHHFIFGLREDLKNYVIFKNPDDYCKARELALYAEAVGPFWHLQNSHKQRQTKLVNIGEKLDKTLQIVNEQIKQAEHFRKQNDGNYYHSYLQGNQINCYNRPYRHHSQELFSQTKYSEFHREQVNGSIV